MSQSILEGIALFSTRLKGPVNEYTQIAEQHASHDLTPKDKENLTAAAKKIGTYTMVASGVGLGLALYGSIRGRQLRFQIYNAAKKADHPVAMKFSDGHEVPFPVNPAELLRPSPLGSFLSTFLWTTASVFIFGEAGLLLGLNGAQKTLEADVESRDRIERAVLSVKADVLRKELKDMEAKLGNSGATQAAGDKVLGFIKGDGAFV